MPGCHAPNAFVFTYDSFIAFTLKYSTVKSENKYVFIFGISSRSRTYIRRPYLFFGEEHQSGGKQSTVANCISSSACRTLVKVQYVMVQHMVHVHAMSKQFSGDIQCCKTTALRHIEQNRTYKYIRDVLPFGDKGAVVEFPKNKGGYIFSGQYLFTGFYGTCQWNYKISSVSLVAMMFVGRFSWTLARSKGIITGYLPKQLNLW